MKKKLKFVIVGCLLVSVLVCLIINLLLPVVLEEHAKLIINGLIKENKLQIDEVNINHFNIEDVNVVDRIRENKVGI